MCIYRATQKLTTQDYVLAVLASERNAFEKMQWFRELFETLYVWVVEMW